MDLVASISNVLAVVDMAGKVVELCWKYYSDVKAARRDIELLCNETTAVLYVFKQVEEVIQDPHASKLPSTEKHIEQTSSEVKKELDTLITKLRSEIDGKKMPWFSIRALKWPLKSADVKRTLEHLERQKTSLIAALNLDQTVVVLGIDDKLVHQIQAMRLQAQKDILSTLPHAEGAAYNHRLWQHEDQCLPDTRMELRRLIVAWIQDPKGARVFWLNGFAGTASFFFARGRGDISHAGKFFTTVARQLAESIPALRPLIAKAIEDHFDIDKQGLDEQWKHLIFEPLSMLKPGEARTLVLVVDALDECEGEDDIRVILQLLAQVGSITTVDFRVFITSRPDAPVRLGFRNMTGTPHEGYVLHDIAPSIVDHDIAIFLRHKLAAIQHGRDIDGCWPEDLAIEKLVLKAAGLFIHAATTCRFVQDSDFDPRDKLDQIIQGTALGPLPTKELDEMYMQVLKLSILGQRDKLKHPELLKRFARIVGAIVVLSDALPLESLARLLSVEGYNNKVWAVIPPDVRTVEPQDEQQILLFFKQDLLHWLEALSMMSRVTDAVSMLNLLVKRWSDKDTAHDALYILAYDAYRFVLHCRPVIEKAPLQIYGSALLFSPKNSKVRKQFYEKMPWLETKFQEPEEWNASLQTLEGHPSHVTAVAFSPDDKLIASASDDSTARLWDIATGATRSILEGHTGPVTAVAFSPNGKLLASVSWDNTIRLWDVPTGSPQRTLEDHTNTVTAVAFSPDGKLIASASDDSTVKIWDAATGAVRSTLKGHLGPVTAVTFSPEGRLVASGSNDSTVRLWDAAASLARGTLEGHLGPVTAVAFSPDGRLIASGSNDSTVRLWHVVSGVVSCVLEGHSGRLTAVAFSPDSKMIASASRGRKVRSWNTVTGAARNILEGHTRRVTGVAFSMDGKLVASASWDKTIRLWDVRVETGCNTLKDSRRRVTAVAFSPDGKLVASASETKTVELWDAVNRAVRNTLEGHSDFVTAVAFSPDGKLIASASDDSTVRVWDVTTGAARSTLEGHLGPLTAVTFSPDGKLITSASDDSTVKIWDAATGAVRSTLKGHLGPVTAVTFSPDGRLIASGSNDSTVRLWDAATGAVGDIFMGHSDRISSIAFSLDGKLIASASDDKTLRLTFLSSGIVRLFSPILASTHWNILLICHHLYQTLTMTLWL
ncbi:hypothetical protein KCU89_g213, partial [Aureobasidium melanogenum]